MRKAVEVRRRAVEVLALVCAIFFSGCKQASSDVVCTHNSYAEGFALEEDSAGICITIFSPWEKGKVLQQLRVGQGESYSRIATTSATHVGFLHALQADSCIYGSCDCELIYNLPTGVTDMGSSIQLDAERVLASEAEIVLLTTFQEDKNCEVLRKVGIPSVSINEWTERHPLARAEWIRVIGALTGRLELADSLFGEVVTQYHSLCVAPGSENLSLMTGYSWQGTWYVPSGNTFMGQLFADAGYRYAYSSDSSGSSLPLSFEQALLAFRDADVWIGTSCTTLSQLREQNERHTWMKAYETHRVYNWLRRTTASGANDFWEMGVVRPDLILKDLRSIMTDAPDSTLFFAAHLE